MKGCHCITHKSPSPPLTPCWDWETRQGISILCIIYIILHKLQFSTWISGSPWKNFKSPITRTKGKGRKKFLFELQTFPNVFEIDMVTSLPRPPGWVPAPTERGPLRCPGPPAARLLLPPHSPTRPASRHSQTAGLGRTSPSHLSSQCCLSCSPRQPNSPHPIPRPPLLPFPTLHDPALYPDSSVLPALCLAVLLSSPGPTAVFIHLATHRLLAGQTAAPPTCLVAVWGGTAWLPAQFPADLVAMLVEALSGLNRSPAPSNLLCQSQQSGPVIIINYKDLCVCGTEDLDIVTLQLT